MITNTNQGQKSLALLLDEFEEEYKSAAKPEHFYALALLVPLLVKALRRAMQALEEKEPLDLSTRSGQIALDLLRNASCHACDGSGAIQVQTGFREYVTREMAKDAGDPSMEGSLYSDDTFEVEQCQWCYERERLLSEHSNGEQGAPPLSPKVLSEITAILEGKEQEQDLEEPGGV